jgi:hypothetical protein
MIDHLSPVEKVLDSLADYRERQGGFRARCPAHRGVSATSLSIREGDDGRALIKCFADCEQQDVVNALGLSMSDLFVHNGHNGSLRGVAKKATKKTLTTDELPDGTYWEFAASTGEVLYIQRHRGAYYRRVGPDLWRKGLEGVTPVLYNLPELIEGVRAGKTVYHLEGPKDVETARERLGVVATTSGGTSSWKPEFKSHYIGADIVVIPDNDAPGLKYAETVARDLLAVAQSVKVANLPGLGKAEDLTDWLNAGHTPEEFFGLVEAASSLSSRHSPLGVPDDDDNNDPPEEPVEVVWFSELGEPKEREFLIEQIGVKGYPIVAFGAGGVAKSFAMLSAGVAIASASGADRWLGLRILEHGYVLYLDFELDVDEQHRRVRDLCAGMGIPIPKRLAYLSGVGISPDKAFSAALSFVTEYEAKAVIVDSMGLAMQGDMERGRDVLAFHGRYINPLRRAGVTPFIVDHEGKLQAGEKHKDKSPFGSAYKAWASRSVLQFELDEYDKEASALDIRVRQTKTNFGPKIEPIGVRFTFGDRQVSIRTFELPDEELIEEESKPVKDRIVGALRIGPATPTPTSRGSRAPPRARFGTTSPTLSRLARSSRMATRGALRSTRCCHHHRHPLGGMTVMTTTSRPSRSCSPVRRPGWLRSSKPTARTRIGTSNRCARPWPPSSSETGLAAPRCAIRSRRSSSARRRGEEVLRLDA